jgi:preprotein translocase subunit SecG
MIELNSSFTVLLVVNSIIIIGLVLNQNESAKDSITSSTASSSVNPLERLTWGTLILQLSLLLIKIKTNDF